MTTVPTIIDPRRRRMRRRTRITLGLIAGFLIATTLPARANPLVCVTLYYQLFGGPRQYVANNQCYVPTGWTSLGSGPSCVLDATRVCYAVTISTP